MPLLCSQWDQFAETHWALRLGVGIALDVMPTEHGAAGQWTFTMCDMPMPAKYVYSSAEAAKEAAEFWLKLHLRNALEKIEN